jgi:hypothetical protein
MIEGLLRIQVIAMTSTLPSETKLQFLSSLQKTSEEHSNQNPLPIIEL